MVFSSSLASRRPWPSQAKVRSTRQRNAIKAKPFFRVLGRDVQFTVQGVGGPLGLAAEALVGREALQLGVGVLGLSHHGTCLRGAAGVGRRDVDGQQRALAIHGHVARAALDPFAPVKAGGLGLWPPS